MADEKQIERGSIYLDKEILKQAKTIGAHEDRPMTEVIEDALRKPLAAKYRKLAEKMTVELGEAGA